MDTSQRAAGSAEANTDGHHPRVQGNLLRRLLGNAFLLGGGKVLTAVFSLLYLALAVRALGLESFGLLVLIHSYAQALGEIVKFQSWQAVLRYGAQALDEGRIGDFRRLIRFTALLDLGSALAGTLTAAAGALFVAPLLGWPSDAVPLVVIYCTSIVFMVSSVPTGILRLFNRFDVLAAQSAVSALIRLLGAGGAYLAGGDLRMFLAVWFLATAVAGVVLIGAAWRELARRNLLHTDQTRIGPFGNPSGQTPSGIWRFVWITNLNTTVGLASTHLTVLAVGALLGAGEAGLFRLARQFAEALTKPARLLTAALYPELVRLVSSREAGRMRRLVIRAGGLAAAGALVILALLAFLGRSLLTLIAGDETAAGAYGVMILLSLASLLALCAFPLDPLLISTGRERRALHIRLATAGVYVPLLLVLLDLYGLIGAGVAALTAAGLSLAGQLASAFRWLRTDIAHGGVRGEP